MANEWLPKTAEYLGATAASRAEVDDLKSQWKADPCYDIDKMYGDPKFGAYWEELAAFQKQQKEQWDRETSERLLAFMAKSGCGENLVLGRFLQSLEWRIKRLENLDE